MILLLDTSTPECHLTLIEGDTSTTATWLAERELAHGLLHFLVEQLAAHDSSLHALEGIGVFRGPGSFTGIRIGIATLNTIADSERIPIVAVMGEDWQTKAVRRLRDGENDGIALPEYGRDARITKPRK